MSNLLSVEIEAAVSCLTWVLSTELQPSATIRTLNPSVSSLAHTFKFSKEKGENAYNQLLVLNLKRGCLARGHMYLFGRKSILRDGVQRHELFVPDNTEDIIENTHLREGTSQIVPH